MKRNYNILICPLEWGLGHAARMIPVARRLTEMGHYITVGSCGQHLALFRSELPGLNYINFSGFNPGYSRWLPQYVSLLMKVPLLLFHIVREHIRLKKIIKEYKIDIIISDNRFGLWNSKITSVYVTHMPRIPFPEPFRFLEITGILLHRYVISKYSLCFIPDLPGELNLTGRLSHDIKLPHNVRYIGILSRFSDKEELKPDLKAGFRHNTVILSGPEPQREMLKQKLTALLNGKEPQSVILEGKPELGNVTSGKDNIICYSNLPAIEMAAMIKSSDCIIARSGYTTIMELISINCSALLIPTPGQTEQEYLADYLSEKGWFSSISQKNLDNGIQLCSMTAEWSDGIALQSSLLLGSALEELLEQHHKKSQSR